MYKQSVKLTFVLHSFWCATLNPPKSVDVSALMSDDMTNLDRDWQREGWCAGDTPLGSLIANVQGSNAANKAETF